MVGTCNGHVSKTDPRPAHKGRMEADRMGSLLEACCFSCITSFIMKPALHVKEQRPREVK